MTAPIQLTVTDGVWFAGCELDPSLPPDALQDKFGAFAIHVFEKHGVDVFGLGLTLETLQ